MNKRIRQLLLTGAGLVFFIVAPAVVLYSIGYRFVPSDETARPVGVLLVDTTPRKADLYVDGEFTGTSPRSVAALNEGGVRVRLEKEGYTTWEKQLEVVATRATEVRAAKLFAADVTPGVIAENVLRYSLAPNRRLLAFVDTAGRLHITDELGEQVRAPIRLGAAPTDLLWSPDSTAMAIQVGGRHMIISIASSADNFVPINVPNIQSLVWDPRLPGRLLILQTSGQIISYSVSTESRQVLADAATLFASTSRNIVVFHKPDQLVWYSLQGEVRRRHTLMTGDVVDELAATPSGNLAVEQAGNVFIITEEGETIPVASQAELVGWSPDGGMLLVQLGGSELAVFNMENERVPYLPLNRLQSVLRLSRPIHHPQWFAGGTHVVFQVDDEIIISEVDTRDYPIQFTVDSTNTGDAVATVGEEGFSIFYLTSRNGTVSLVNRLLVLEKDQ